MYQALAGRVHDQSDAVKSPALWHQIAADHPWLRRLPSGKTAAHDLGKAAEQLTRSRRPFEEIRGGSAC